MTEATAAAAAPKKAAKKSAKKSAKKAAKKTAKKASTGTKRDRSAVIPRTAIIHMGKDAEGNKYGGKNNPCRNGSNVADRFSNLKDGMTVEKAVAAGVRRSDIPYLAEHGFIKVETPKHA